ncbi:unnamed protein product [Caenorhabditis angaria]|uniref:GRIP domain-containing protein n=1 Tax=Caenorhabditis angaria TaxID=860376 RepID=A0A9P1NBA4_9PELO|nr:unnamed protein product [Caenorhabditis angaria]
MDSEHQSSYESLSLNNYDDFKSPESSDWEDYATPLAGSFTSLAEMQIDIVTTHSDEEPKEFDSRELTPIIRVETPINDLFLRNDEEIVEEILEDILLKIVQNEKTEQQLQKVAQFRPRSIITPVGCSHFLNSSSSEEEEDEAENDEEAEIVSIFSQKQTYPTIFEEPEDQLMNSGRKKEEEDGNVEMVEEDGVERIERQRQNNKTETVNCCISKMEDKIIQVNNLGEDFKMENLKLENDRLRFENEELAKELANVQKLLKEANHTIDEIEVEAEQQYTEMTSEIDELCEVVMKKDEELAGFKEKVATFQSLEQQRSLDMDSQKNIANRQKEVIEELREEVDGLMKKLSEMTKLKDKAVEEATLNKIKNQENERFLAGKAQLSVEIEDLQRELNKQKMILNNTSMSKLADAFEKKIVVLENDVRERDMLICKQNQLINSQRKSPTGIKKPFGGSRAAALAAEIPSAGSSSESFQHGLDQEAKDTIMSFILSDRYMQLANIYNIGRILELLPHEERALERHLTKDRFT